MSELERRMESPPTDTALAGSSSTSSSTSNVSTNLPFALSRTLSPAARVYRNAQEARLMTDTIQRVSHGIEEEQGFLWRLHCIMQDRAFETFLDLYGKTAADMSVLSFYFKLYQNVQRGYRKRYEVEAPASYMLFFMKQIMMDRRYRNAAMRAFKAFNEQETADYTFVEELIDDGERFIADRGTTGFDRTLSGTN